MEPFFRQRNQAPNFESNLRVRDCGTNRECGSRQPSALLAHGSDSKRSYCQDEDGTEIMRNLEAGSVHYNSCSSRGWKLGDGG